jgi:hypothetical protein
MERGIVERAQTRFLNESPGLEIKKVGLDDPVIQGYLLDDVRSGIVAFLLQSLSIDLE